jgi:hypothetical protein
VDDWSVKPEFRDIKVRLCENEGNNIPKDQPPTPAKALTAETMEQINITVMGLAALDPGKPGGFSEEFLAASEADLAEFFEENNPFLVEPNLCNN